MTDASNFWLEVATQETPFSFDHVLHLVAEIPTPAK